MRPGLAFVGGMVTVVVLELALWFLLPNVFSGRELRFTFAPAEQTDAGVATVAPAVARPPGQGGTIATGGPAPPPVWRDSAATAPGYFPEGAVRSGQPSSAPAPGSLLIPVAGVQPADLVDTYTQARGAGRRHDAIDIPAPRGTPVVAAADGTVLKLFRSVPGGVTLYQLAPGRRTIYYYAHLDRYAPGITEGKRLRAGEILGYVGDTGNAGAGNYHLHFGVSLTDDPARYWGGEDVNPYPLLVGSGSR